MKCLFLDGIYVELLLSYCAVRGLRLIAVCVCVWLCLVVPMYVCEVMSLSGLLWVEANVHFHYLLRCSLPATPFLLVLLFFCIGRWLVICIEVSKP